MQNLYIPDGWSLKKKTPLALFEWSEKWSQPKTADFFGGQRTVKNNITRLLSVETHSCFTGRQINKRISTYAYFSVDHLNIYGHMLKIFVFSN